MICLSIECTNFNIWNLTNENIKYDLHKYRFCHGHLRVKICIHELMVYIKITIELMKNNKIRMS